MSTSLFGAVDDAERRRWQLRNHATLTGLLQLGQEHNLPPLNWTLPVIGLPTGEVRYYAGAPHPRDQFEVWFAELTQDLHVNASALDAGGDADHRRERTSDLGKTTLIAAFDLKRSRFLITASWYEDEFVGVATPKAGA